MLVLIVVIYSQIRFQQRLVRNYVPGVEFVKMSSCQAYGDRIRTVNLEGAKLKLDRVRKVRHIRVEYMLANTSLAPVSLQQASLAVNLKKERLSLPAETAVVELGPSESGLSKAVFRLPREIDYEDIDSVNLEVKGNCTKSIDVKPRLYVNFLIRQRKPEFIFEPYGRFIKR
jgi:hypothetical protein